MSKTNATYRFSWNIIEPDLELRMHRFYGAPSGRGETMNTFEQSMRTCPPFLNGF